VLTVTKKDDELVLPPPSSLEPTFLSSSYTMYLTPSAYEGRRRRETLTPDALLCKTTERLHGHLR
jgi:hypothetical protein